MDDELDDFPSIDEMMEQVRGETLEQMLDRLEPMAKRLNERNEAFKKYLRAHGSIVPHLDIRFTHKGLLCGIGLSPVRSMNGYVKLPKTLFDATPDYDALSERVSCHGGLTYGPDAGRWVGFDCAHSGDLWPWRELAPYVRKRGPEAIHKHRLWFGGCGIIPPGSLTKSYGTPWERVWSVKQLEGEVRHLADQIVRVARGERVSDDEHLAGLLDEVFG